MSSTAQTAEPNQSLALVVECIVYVLGRGKDRRNEHDVVRLCPAAESCVEFSMNTLFRSSVLFSWKSWSILAPLSDTSKLPPIISLGNMKDISYRSKRQERARFPILPYQDAPHSCTYISNAQRPRIRKKLFVG